MKSEEFPLLVIVLDVSEKFYVVTVLAVLKAKYVSLKVPATKIKIILYLIIKENFICIISLILYR